MWAIRNGILDTNDARKEFIFSACYFLRLSSHSHLLCALRRYVRGESGIQDTIPYFMTNVKSEKCKIFEFRCYYTVGCNEQTQHLRDKKSADKGKFYRVFRMARTTGADTNARSLIITEIELSRAFRISATFIEIRNSASDSVNR